MFRYVALAWNSAVDEQCDAARLLSLRLQARPKPWGQVRVNDGLCVLHPPVNRGSLGIQRLPADRGVLLGSVFHRKSDCTDDSAAPRFTPDFQQSDAIADSRGRWLIERTWGNYVALLQDEDERIRWLLKDPAGNLPCFHTSFRGVHVAFAHIADLVATGLFEFSIASGYLEDRVLHGGMADKNALRGVVRIERGECVELGTEPAPRNRKSYWDPLQLADATDAIEDADYAMRAIRATVRSCTRTLCSDHDSVLLRLSGGLDSSIIAACLGDVPQRPSLCCYTYFTPGGRSDERPWARLAASRHNLLHQEHPVTPDTIPLPVIVEAPPLIEPTQVMGYLHRSTLEHRIAIERDATAVFCGDGGDSAFCGDTYAYAASEYMRRHGFGTRAFQLAAQIASLTEESSWTVLFKSLRRWRRGVGMEYQRKVLLPVSNLLSADVRQAYFTIERFPHPWLKHLDPVPWALVRRLGALLSPPEFYNCAIGSRAPEVISPLYAQPATELFLRIPLYVHFHGGRERGLARQAFAQDVPEEILRRSWKDRAPGFLDQLVQRHRKFLRSLLLDGVLVEEGLLNRSAVEDAFSDRMSTSVVYPGELLRYLDVEVWARQWQRLARVTPAPVRGIA